MLFENPHPDGKAKEALLLLSLALLLEVPTIFDCCTPPLNINL
jgi:hypothetical protein